MIHNICHVQQGKTRLGQICKATRAATYQPHSTHVSAPKKLQPSSSVSLAIKAAEFRIDSSIC